MCVILQALKSSCKVLEKLSTKVLNPECWNSNLHCHIDVQPGAAPLTMITGVGEQTPGTCFWRWQTALSAHWYWLNPRRAARRHISNLSATVRLFVFPTPPRLVQVCYGILLLQTHCWDLHGQIQWILTSHIFLSWLPQCNFLMSASQIRFSCSLSASPHAMSCWNFLSRQILGERATRRRSLFFNPPILFHLLSFRKGQGSQTLVHFPPTRWVSVTVLHTQRSITQCVQAQLHKKK